MTGLNFERISWEISERWEETDKSIYIVHNFSDVRALQEVKVDGQLFENNTIPEDPADYLTGQNLVLNDTDVWD
jgi:hypothetical protein